MIQERTAEMHDGGAESEPGDRARTKERSAQRWEQLLGGRVLAWIGGVAVLVGLALLFALAVSHGWVSPAGRTLLAAAGSLLLLAAGAWLHEHRGRTDAAMVATATAISGLFATVTVASVVYAILPVPAALGLAVLIGGVAVALAVRWRAQGIAALGIVGSLLAPVLVGAPGSAATTALLFVAGLSAVGVLVWQRWAWLACVAFVITTPQWAIWLLSTPELPVVTAVAVLSAFGALTVAAALGLERQAPAESLRASSTFLLVCNALVLGLVGRATLLELGAPLGAKAWLVALAAAHVAAGCLALWRLPAIGRETGLLLVVIGVLVGDVVLTSVVSGPGIPAAWALTGVVCAGLLSRSGHRPRDASLAALGLGGHTALALISAFLQAPPSAIGAGVEALLGPALGLAAVAAGCFTSARLAGVSAWRQALDSLGLLVSFYLTAVTLDGAALAAAWALEAAALALIARRTRDVVAAGGASVYLAAAGMLALAVAPPDALVHGLEDPVGAAVALGAVAFGALRLGDMWRAEPVLRWAMALAAGVFLLYLASTVLIGLYQPGSEQQVVGDIDLPVRQQGQLLLSVLWSVVGVATLVVGLRADLPALRLGALALLGIVIAKVFLYDLSTLTSLYRVVSFIALGLFLLLGAFAYQRLQRAPLPDLRSVPPGLR